MADGRIAEEVVAALWRGERPAPERVAAAGGLYALIAARARLDPGLTAVRDPLTRLTYRELDHAARTVAADLRAAGVRPGEVVAVCAGPSVPYVAGVAGVLAAGAAFLPVDPELPPARIGRLLEDAGPAACLVAGEVSLPEGVRSLPIRLDGPAPPEPVMAGDDALAYVLYTSGSTGRPKGVRCHHRGVLSLLGDLIARAPVPVGAVCAWWTAPGFDVSVYEIFSALLGGELLVVPPAVRTDPTGFLDLLAAERVASAYVPPFLLADLADRAEAGPGSLGLRRLLVGVEPIQERLLRRIAVAAGGARVLNGYGPTEAHVCATVYEVPAEPAADGSLGRTPIGRPVGGSQVHVLDPRLGPVSPGEVGELYVSGAGVAHGYHRAPEATAAAFRWIDVGTGRVRAYRTGDLVRERADGELMFVGRADDQLKVRGHRVEPGEIEAVLLEHRAVRAAAVTCPHDAPDLLCAYVEPAEPLDAAAETLRAHLAARLPAYLVPGVIAVVDRLPVTAHGKLDRARLARRTPPLAPDGDGRPASDGERYVQGVWARVLGGTAHGVHTHFLDVGGHSLAAIRVAGHVRRDTGADVTVADVYANPTIAGFAASLDARNADFGRPAAPARSGAPLAPLSAAQEALFLLHRMYPDNRAYHIPTLHEITGPLDTAALGRALLAVRERHTALRSTLVEVGSTVAQRVGPAEPLPLDVTDLAGLSGERQAAELRRLAGEASTAAWDLRAEPPLRVRLFRLAARRHALLLVAHHLFSDGWSVEIVQRDLSAAYRSIRAGQEPNLPEAAQATDFAKAERDPEQRERVARHVEYWKRRLSAAPVPRSLPMQRPRRREPRFAADRLGFTLDRAATEALRALARSRGIGLFSVLATGFTTVIARYLGQPGFVLGVPVAGRADPERAGSVGFFNNSLAVPCTVDGRASFAGNAAAFHEELLAALSHDEAPFARVVAELRPPRQPGANPLFRFWCNMLSYPRHPLRLDGCAVQASSPPVPGALFDLSCYLTEHPDRIEVELVYDADLYDRDRIAALAGHCREVYANACAAPDGPVGEMLSAAPVPPRAPAPEQAAPDIGELFTAAASAHPDRLALRTGSTGWTYRRLAQAVDEQAGELRHAGAGPGRPVAILADRTPRLVVGILAALRTGTPFVLLDRAHPGPRLRRMAARSLPRTWIDATAPGATADGRGLSRLPRADAGTTGVTGEVPVEAAYIAFTSGTTAEPRGVVVGRGPLAAFTERHRAEHGIGPGDRFALLAGIGHDPLLREVLVPLTSGAALLIPGPEEAANPARLVSWLAGGRVGVLYATPATVRVLAGAAQAARITLPAVRLLGFGGAAVEPGDVHSARRMAPNARLESYYGATETPQVVAVADPSDARAAPLIGTGYGEARLLVVEPDGRPAPVNVAGEIVVSGPHLALGYLGDDVATAQRFHSVPEDGPGVRRYRTGDRGCRRPDGRIEFGGRLDRQLDLHGTRAEPGEIEYLARTHPQVRECLVTGPGETGVEVLTAYVEPAGPGLTAADVRGHLAALLPVALVPADIVLVAAIPLNPHGKPDPRLLPARPAPVPRAGGPVAERIAAIWSAALGVPYDGLDDNFFDAGGTSVTLLTVRAHLERLTGSEVPLSTLFAHPTVRTMAAALSHLKEAER
ncbi:hypothetical protein DP939_14845 [Spongiactinospora rosea]|uniref:Carrier domain-containing protein n=1 Tax=Spongiactinospora rosea TaxID=2248750 RepID=A0A366LZ29_9ACTN|nr:non-ribosomal peptide synthetase [Spongiactinospora rosea]RBQ19216.1 hypothetical protein DP939_14845 [Spongiactinospora rosea]